GLHDAVKADELADDESHVVLDDARSAKSSLTPGCRPGRRSGLRSRESAPRGGKATWCGRGRWARPPTASRGVVMSGPAPRTALRRRNRVLSAVTVVLLGPVAPLAVAATTPPASPTPGRHDATTGRALPAFRPPAPNAYLRRLALAGTPVAPPPRRLAASQLAFVFRWGAVNERRLVAAPVCGAIGVRFRLGGGKGTPVAGGSRRGPRPAVPPAAAPPATDS